jgi:hypothetical protein
VLEAEFSALTAEVRRIFLRIEREMRLRHVQLAATNAPLPESPPSQSTAPSTSSASLSGARS